MTVIVGILCDDGVVIGSDSAISFGVGDHFRIIERPDCVKVHVIGNKLLTAITGEVGLAQRYIEKLKALHAGGLNKAKVMEQATDIANTMIQEFQRTTSPTQSQPQRGWGIGCLLALPLNGQPELFEFDHIQFHPERVGDKDSQGKCRRPRVTSMGSGQSLADPFLSFASGLFWGQNDAPKLVHAKLVVTWTLQHAIKLNPGGIGGEVQLGVLEKIGGDWKAHMVDLEEIKAQIVELEQHIKEYREKMLKKIDEAEEPPKKAQAAGA